MATIYEIAAEARVSPNTVSRVLNGKLKGNYPAVAAKAKRVLEISQRLGYRPNAAARAIQSRSTRQVGVLLRNKASRLLQFINLQAFEIVLGINERMRGDGYVVSLVHVDDVAGGLPEQSRVFREHLLDGVIVVGNMPHGLGEQLPSLVPAIVWLDTDVYEPTNCIRRDEAAAGRGAAEALLSAGRKQLCWLGGRSAIALDDGGAHYSAGERYEGAAAAASALGIKLEFIANMPWLNAGRAAGEVLKLFQRDVGLIAYNVDHARWIAALAAEHRLIPGVDFGLACCDDGPDLTNIWPGLSRAGFDRYALGWAGADMAIDLLAGKPQASRRVAEQWITGTTAGKAPA